MVNVFSDASCRNFGNTKNVNSYFVGNSLDYNLSSKDTCDLILDSINKIEHQSVENNYIHFGEYDIRLSLGFGKFPHSNHRLNTITPNKRFINRIIENYQYLINQLPTNFKIISTISSFPAYMYSMEYFNYKVLLNNSEKFIDMFDKMVNKGLKPTHQIKKEYKCEFYTANPYICNPIETSKLFCDMINIEYEYEEKGNMQNYGTFYIS